jgi:hypothetical protein
MWASKKAISEKAEGRLTLLGICRFIIINDSKSIPPKTIYLNFAYPGEDMSSPPTECRYKYILE